MTATTRESPSYGEEMYSQHARLRLLLRAVDEVLASPGEPPEGAELGSALVVLIADLHRELPLHFAFEEQEGYFLDVGRLAPERGKDLDQLRRDHLEMTDRTGALLELAREVLEGSRRWGEAQSAFGALSRRLIAHERKENDILQEVFSMDIGQPG